MSFELNSEGDFSEVVDGLEAITLQRRESAEAITVAGALRAVSKIEEADAAGGHVARHDIEWQFPWDNESGLPRLGDQIIDADGDCWTILSVEQRSGGARLRCVTRNLHLVYGLLDRVDLQQAIWEDMGSGLEIVGWNTVRTAVPARIQPERVAVDDDSAPVSSTATYRVILAEQIELDHNWRVLDSHGVVYRIVDYTQAQRIDVLPVVTVVKQAAAT